MIRRIAAGAACLAALVSGSVVGLGATSASAATTITYGFDGNAHLVVIGGSDTVYTTLTQLADLWQKDFTVNNITTGTNYGDTCAVDTVDVQNTSGTYPPPSSNPVANQYSNKQLNSSSPSQTNPALTNCNHDTIANAYPAGSSTGISSLNGGGGSTAVTIPYEGTNSNILSTYTNGYGTVDLARSSRQPNTSAGKCPGTVSSTNNELACDTFWGFASDEIQVFSWNYGTAVNRGAELAALPGGLTADDIYNIWNCNWTSWSQVPGLSSETGFVDGPIVPWGMNTGSGTEGTFQSWIIHNATASAPSTSWKIDNQGCDRALSSGVVPFENDTKPLLTDANISGYTVSDANYQTGVTSPWDGTYNAGLVDNASSPQDPSNWIWWGSFGLMTAYTYNSQPVLPQIQSAPFQIQAAKIYNPGATGTSPPTQQASSCSGGTASEPGCTGTLGQLPAYNNIGKYPLSRDLYLVSPKATADCPLNSSSVCDLTGTPASGEPGDIQVNGASGGVAGAAREFVRFLCRSGAGQQQLDPFSPGSNAGTNFATEISSALTANGFASVQAQSTTKPLTMGYQSIYKQAGLGKSIASGCSVLSNPTTTPSP